MLKVITIKTKRMGLEDIISKLVDRKDMRKKSQRKNIRMKKKFKQRKSTTNKKQII